ncbi:MAG: hybrid sensor histidine kinase/response regulator, partial [Burkholderia sp.]|nr:hybrid sensor histidine kinase/response regulator [Burkholderia sp.]
MISSERALILAPSGRDANVAVDLLRSVNKAAEICVSLPDLVRGIQEGAGLAIIAAEALQFVDVSPIRNWIENQPTWSDFPLIILGQPATRLEASPIVAQLQATLGNVIVLERPFHSSTLINAVVHALRVRRRQYQSRRYIEESREVEQRLQTAL